MDIRTIEVDYDNLSDLKYWISRLQKRRTNLFKHLGINVRKKAFAGSDVCIAGIIPALDEIYNTDIGSLYPEKDPNKRYYVYFHCDPRTSLDVLCGDLRHYWLAKTFNNLKFLPFYVGKGTGNRYLEQERNGVYTKISSQIKKIDQKVIFVKVIENLTENEAFAFEAKLIDILGLRSISSSGYLSNLDEGCSSAERRRLYRDERYINHVLKTYGYIYKPENVLLSEPERSKKAVYSLFRKLKENEEIERVQTFREISETGIKLKVRYKGSIEAIPNTYKSYEVIKEEFEDR